MVENKFFIYLDILGFDKIPEILEKKSGFDEDIIRERFFSEPLKTKIQEIGKGRIKWTKGISAIEGSDNYVLLVNDIDKVFEILTEVTTIEIHHKDYDFVPLEIAVDKREDVETLVKDPINKKSVIKFLKNDILTPFRKKYKKERNVKYLDKTFILFTISVFIELRIHQKKECKQYDYKKENRTGSTEKSYYYIPIGVIEREKKISDFLNELGQLKSDYTGALIDKIYVPPNEFNTIKKTLKEDRIVIITGTQGYGKTYTAIRLMWEYFNKGYKPLWIPGGSPEERIKARKKLVAIDAELKPHHIFYFEDPFGKISYERYDDLTERINPIIDSIKNTDDVYVIITSERSVFEELEKESYSTKEIRKFEKELNIQTPSYSYEKRKEILKKWAEEKSCEWLRNRMLKNYVFELLKGKTTLQTPHRIYAFTRATKRINDRESLGKNTQNYSSKDERVFADEILGLYDSKREDRILVLSLVFVSEYFDIDFIKKVYKKLKKKYYEDFETILKEERRLKTEKHPFLKQNRIKFTHPAYLNTLPYLLNNARFKNEFSELLIELSKDTYFACSVVETIVWNYEKLTDDTKNLLFELSEKGWIAGCLASAIVYNYGNIPNKVRNLLFKLSEVVPVADDVAWAITFNYKKLPEVVKNILYKLAENDQTAEPVAWAIAENYKKLPENVRNSLLIKLAEKEQAAKNVAEALAEYFHIIPEGVRNQLLIKLSDKPQAKEILLKIVKEHRNEFPKNIRNLLGKLQQRKIK